eukprot:GGOE01036415.1.p1 GENE.GGOE01036415.1~~GGOE01036415.1.p1  ORF type:complete len:633 (-),score=124.62 GGOE01036415.1:76-1914(-)
MPHLRHLAVAFAMPAFEHVNTLGGVMGSLLGVTVMFGQTAAIALLVAILAIHFLFLEENERQATVAALWRVTEWIIDWLDTMNRHFTQDVAADPPPDTQSTPNDNQQGEQGNESSSTHQTDDASRSAATSSPTRAPSTEAEDAAESQTTVQAEEVPGVRGQPAADLDTFPDIGLQCGVPWGWEAKEEDGSSPQSSPQMKVLRLTLKAPEVASTDGCGHIFATMVECEQRIPPEELVDKLTESATTWKQVSVEGFFETSLEGSLLEEKKFLSFITVRGKYSCVVQYINTGCNFDTHVKIVKQWASTFKLFDQSVIRFTSAVHEMQVDIPSEWTLIEQAGDAIKFRTPGQDLVMVSKSKSNCSSAQEHLEERLQAAGATPLPNGSTPVMEGVAKYHYPAEGKDVFLVCTKDHAVEVRPHDNTSTQPEIVLRELLRSIHSVSPEAAGQSSMRFINKRHCFSFVRPTTEDGVATGSLEEFKFHKVAMIYSPSLQPTDNKHAFMVMAIKSCNDLQDVKNKLQQLNPQLENPDWREVTFGTRTWSTCTTPIRGHENLRSKVFICHRENQSKGFVVFWDFADGEPNQLLMELMDGLDVDVDPNTFNPSKPSAQLPCALH